MLRFLRIAGCLEGVTYLVLLTIAMPLKYFAGFPQAVEVVGGLHGGAFILFVLAVIWLGYYWDARDTAMALAASLLPAGTFIMDRRWRKLVAAAANQTPASER